MFTKCLQYVYKMFTICLQYVYNIFTICLQNVYNMFAICLQYIYNMFTKCLQYVYKMFTICLQYVYNMFTICSITYIINYQHVSIAFRDQHRGTYTGELGIQQTAKLYTNVRKVSQTQSVMFTLLRSCYIACLNYYCDHFKWQF
jgi:hypothetical protein